MNPLDPNLFKALGRACLRPRRAHIKKVRGLDRHVESPEEIWEAAATRGLIPTSWSEDPARRFTTEPSRWVRDAWRKYLSATPTDRLAALTLAADAKGVARAELSAREWHARRKPFGQEGTFAGVIWRVRPERNRDGLWVPWDYGVDEIGASIGNETTDHLEQDGAAFRPPLRAMVEAFEEGVMGRDGASETTPLDAVRAHSVVLYASATIRRTVAYDEAQRRDLTFSAAFGHVPKGARFADLANPHAPALDILQSGYYAQGLYQDDGRCWAVLVAPSLTPEDLAR